LEIAQERDAREGAGADEIKRKGDTLEEGAESGSTKPEVKDPGRGDFDSVRTNLELRVRSKKGIG